MLTAWAALWLLVMLDSEAELTASLSRTRLSLDQYLSYKYILLVLSDVYYHLPHRLFSDIAVDVTDCQPFSLRCQALSRKVPD